ncbi:hypothetical protein G647_09023 [Cladophialophora carrionii CBS 160.54]|uniref:Uncharacterized protein n=1 Tax=Cladophialophora carrionii CBS 160.54 TaxID=1279043 RepID=V9D154_9EURO|nr:uncharacterized protein G647_09023 [Cladophialophora carrionii CBS 160.54]ETI20008.1 hypothetical protein G647_09023 [Cladophialophora carrionii CBS 160.54]
MRYITTGQLDPGSKGRSFDQNGRLKCFEDGEIIDEEHTSAGPLGGDQDLRSRGATPPEDEDLSFLPPEFSDSEVHCPEFEAQVKRPTYDFDFWYQRPSHSYPSVNRDDSPSDDYYYPNRNGYSDISEIPLHHRWYVDVPTPYCVNLSSM